MKAEITSEMAQALANAEEVSVTDPRTQRVYVLVDHDMYRKAMQALRQQQDVDAIQAGIEDMEAGRMQPAAEAQQHGRNELLARFKE